MAVDSTALCAAHSAPAMGPCERCGTFVCPQCGFRERQHIRCFPCGPPVAERPPPMAFTALILSALGMMCPPMSLLGIGLGLAFQLRKDGSSGLGAQYARWALVVGVMSLVAGGGLYALVIMGALAVGDAIPSQD